MGYVGGLLAPVGGSSYSRFGQDYNQYYQNGQYQARSNNDGYDFNAMSTWTPARGPPEPRSVRSSSSAPTASRSPSSATSPATPCNCHKPPGHRSTDLSTNHPKLCQDCCLVSPPYRVALGSGAPQNCTTRHRLQYTLTPD